VLRDFGHCGRHGCAPIFVSSISKLVCDLEKRFYKLIKITVSISIQASKIVSDDTKFAHTNPKLHG
jgi:hypothetical protein